MDDLQAQNKSIESTSKGGFPPCTCGYGVDKTEHIMLKQQAHRWRTSITKTKNREEALKQKVIDFKAGMAQTIHDLKAEPNRLKRQFQLEISNLKKEATKKLADAVLTVKTEATEQQRQLKDEIAQLKQELESAKAQVIQFKKMVFGKKSEKQSASNAKATYGRHGKRRGQQKGTRGHGRTIVTLPEKEEIVELPHPQNRCRRCHLTYQPMNATDDSEVIEIDIQAHKRVIKRMKYKRHPHCNCYCSEKFRTAPLPGKCISKGKFGASVYANLLVGKFGYQIPLYRLIKQFELYGIT